MSNTPTEGCPRCDDYDEVVEELKKEKGNREQRTKSELQRCEDRHKKKDTKIKGMEKKILTMTIIAVVAGTVLGKDFIDQIASYINSFNSVKDAASKLTSSLPVTNENEVAKEENNNEEEPEDLFVLELTPRTIDTTMWPALVSMSNMNSPNTNQFSMLSSLDSFSPMTDLLTPPTLVDMLLENVLNDINLFEESIRMPSMSDIYELSSYGTNYTEPFGTPTYYAPATSYVPETGSWLIIGAIPFVGMKRRRRVS